MARKKKDRRRRRGRFTVVYKLLCVLLILAALFAGCISFFRVNQVEVTGNDRYAPQEIIEASGVQTGEYLFLLDRAGIRDSILQALPYVEQVRPVIRLPDRLELQVVESPSRGAVQAGGSWWLINVDGKVQATGDHSVVGELPQVLGLTPEEPTVGLQLTVPEEEQDRLDKLCALLRALADWDMTENLRGFVDLSSTSVIRFGYGEGLTVVVPANGDMARQVYALRRVLETFAQRGEVVSGTLDLSYSDEEARLLLEQWKPEGWAEKGESDDGTADGAGAADAGGDAAGSGADAPA